MPQCDDVRMYRAGRFVGTRSLDAIRRMYASGQVSLEHNRKGQVIAAHERELSGVSSMSSKLHSGTKYVYEEKPETLWDLKRLGGASRQSLNYAPAETRRLFLEVLRSCLSPSL